MGFGSNGAVKEAEDEYCDDLIEWITKNAAELVASGDESRKDAIKKVIEYFEDECAADGDPTGVIAAENTFPQPSRKRSPKQVRAIEDELREYVEDATRNFRKGYLADFEN